MATQQGAGAESVIEESTPNHLIGCWDNRLLLLVWRRDTTAQAAQRLREVCGRRWRGRPRSVAMVTLIEAGTILPSGEVRRELSAGIDEFRDELAASALVFEGKGFRAAVVMSLVTALAQLARPPYPHRVFTELDAALDFLAPKIPGPGAAPSVTELASIVSRLRELGKLG